MSNTIQPSMPAARPAPARTDATSPAEPQDTFQHGGPVFANGFVSGFVSGSVSGYVPGMVNGNLTGSINGTLMGSDGRSYPINAFVNVPVSTMANGLAEDPAP